MSQKLIFEKKNYLEEMVGKTWNNKLRNQADKLMIDSKLKWSLLNQKLPTRDYGILHYHEPGKPYGKEVLGITHSIPSDLLVDNYASILACIFNISGTPNTTNTKDDTGAAQSIKSSGANAWNASAAYGLATRLGLGSTPPTFGDTRIQTFCASAPESNYHATTTTQTGFTVGNGHVNIVDSIGPFGATEVITEGGIYMQTQTPIAGGYTMLCQRVVYAVSLTVPSGTTATLNHTIIV